MQKYIIDLKQYGANYMRCRDRYKNIYLTVKCIPKKSITPYLNEAIIDEINLLKSTQCKILPTLCKIFEDEN